MNKKASNIMMPPAQYAIKMREAGYSRDDIPGIAHDLEKFPGVNEQYIVELMEAMEP